MNKIYFSFKDNATVPGVGTVRDEDIVSYDAAADEWGMFFDGSDVGLGGTDVDAFSVRADGSIVLSVNSGSFSLAGLVGNHDRRQRPDGVHSRIDGQLRLPPRRFRHRSIDQWRGHRRSLLAR